MPDAQSKHCWKVRFLSILNGTKPGNVHGCTRQFITKSDVVAMTKDGLIECEHPKQWGQGEMDWPAPSITITQKGKDWLNSHSTLTTLTQTHRAIPGESQPETHDGFWG